MNIAKNIHIEAVWLIFGAYACGIFLASECSPPTAAALRDNLWFFPAAAALTLIVSCNNRQLWLGLSLSILACGFGCHQYIHATQPAGGTTDLSSMCDKQALNIEATVVRIDPQPERWRMDVDLKQISRNHLTSPARGKIRVQVLPPPDGREILSSRLSILPGDHIIFRATLRQPRRFNIPGEFDYPAYLARAGIFYTACITNPDTIVTIDSSEAINWRCRIERWRTQLGRKIETYFSPQHSAYLLSLTLGQKSRLSTQQRQQLADYGISHLFSISGLHLGLLAWLLYQIIIRLYRRSERLLLAIPAQTASMILTLPALFLYLMLSGAALPTIRAMLMLCIGVIAMIYQRHTSSTSILALVALLILVSDPSALFSPSFQLSFAGVGAILICLPPAQRACSSKLSRWLLLPTVVTAVATLATAPIALWHFHSFAPAAIICNMIAVPMIGMLTVPLALSGTLLIGMAPDIGVILLKLSVKIIDLTIMAAGHIASGPLAGRQIFLSPRQHIVLALLCLTLLLLGIRRWRSGATIALFSSMLWLGIFLQPPPAALQLTPFSIGQGDSLLLRLGADKTYLIDGGGLYSKKFDVGRQLLAPALGYLGIKHLDAVILSHDHPDHRKGLIYILKHFAVDQFWCSIPVGELHYSVQQVLNMRHIPVRLFTPGWSSIPVEGKTTLDIFAPTNRSGNMNDRSLVVLAHRGRDGILLTGDLEKTGIKQLLAQPLPATISLLKLPHHGSRGSAPHRLLQATQPKIAVASVGYGNKYGFPHPEVIAEVNKVGAQLIRTDYDGTLQFSSWGDGWTTNKL